MLSRVQVERLLEWIDQKTADEVLVRFSLLYEFAVIEIGGRIYTTAGELKEVFGYRSEEAIRKLLREYGIKPLSLKELTTQLKVGSSKEEISRLFGVPMRNVHRLKLLDYRAFLVVALSSRTEKAKEVKLYLMEMEREARQRITLAKKGYTPEGLKELALTTWQMERQIKQLQEENRMLRRELQLLGAKPYISDLQYENLTQRISEFALLLYKLRKQKGKDTGY